MTFISCCNGESVAWSDVPELPVGQFLEGVLCATEDGARIVAWMMAAVDGRKSLLAALAQDETGTILLGRTIPGERYRSITPDCPQAHLFERALHEEHGIVPEGHPWLKAVRYPLSSGAVSGGVGTFFSLAGEGVHEVAVGPVHAGVIEPGHFRFQCQGETVHHLEIALGYQHRGILRALAGGPYARTIHHMETLAGDTSIGHAMAYARCIEALCDCTPSPDAERVRGVALELERLACHTGDLGALAGDVGFLPTSSYCGRLRGDFLNMTALICGNRFGRGLVRPGGVAWGIEPERAARLVERVDKTYRDTAIAANLLWETPSVMARFEGTGVVRRQTVLDLGLVGPAARASGVERDARFNFPTGIYALALVPMSTAESGDVFGRALVRWLEIERSVEFVREQLAMPMTSELMTPAKAMRGSRVAVGLIEGWRGEIAHVAVTDATGRFAGYSVTDPSFHNWTGLAMALRGEGISDFPLCNKSFNLSYCGHDL